MSGAAWAALSGVGFGCFQTLNGAANRGLTGAMLGTFLQLVVATVVLLVAALLTEDVSMIFEASPRVIAIFAAAGVIHFLIGWTTLNVSHARIGAARTSPLLATTPLFGLLIAAVSIGQVPTPLGYTGVALVISGAMLAMSRGPGEHQDALRDAAFGLATAAAWAISSVLITEGLQDFASPLLGVTVGVLAATLCYGTFLLLVKPSRLRQRQESGAVRLKVLAGAVVALATWGRWLALEGAPVATVLALSLLSVPTVMALVAFLPGGQDEPITGQTLTGAGLVIFGCLLLLSGS